MMIVHCLQGLRLSVAGALPMKINFTKKEYQALVEMLLTADWVIRSHEDEPRAETKPYDALRKKVLSHYKEMGMEDAFEYDPDRDEYFETRDYEEQAPHMGYIDEYDERSFWSLLASKLASRDLAAEEALSAAGALDEERRSVRLFEIIERYEEVFAESGLDSVRVAAKTTGLH
jgi:hypothetical protein